MWPSIMRGLMDRLANSKQGYSLRLEDPDGWYRLWMSFVMDGRCWNVILAEVERRSGWEGWLIDFLAHAYAGVENACSPVGIYSLAAPTLIDILGTDLAGRESSRIPSFNRYWFERCLRAVFLSVFKRHETFPLVEFLIVRLETALSLRWMDECPILVKVSLPIFVNCYYHLIRLIFVFVDCCFI